MKFRRHIFLLAPFVVFTITPGLCSAVRGADPFVRQENVVYAEDFGVGLVMDIFTPNGEKNGLAIVDVISGAWHSDRGKMRDHQRAQMFNIYRRSYNMRYRNMTCRWN